MLSIHKPDPDISAPQMGSTRHMLQKCSHFQQPAPYKKNFITFIRANFYKVTESMKTPIKSNITTFFISLPNQIYYTCFVSLSSAFNSIIPIASGSAFPY